MLIGAGDTPVAADGHRRAVLEPRATRPGGRARLFDHQPGGAELGEVLTDGVVVQLEARRQGRHVDGAWSVGDGPDDGVAGGIPEGLGLALHVAIPIRHGAPTPDRTLAHTRPASHSSSRY